MCNFFSVHIHCTLAKRLRQTLKLSSSSYNKEETLVLVYKPTAAKVSPYFTLKFNQRMIMGLTSSFLRIMETLHADIGEIKLP